MKKKIINEFLRPSDLLKREQRYHYHVQLSTFPDFIFILIYSVYFMVMGVPTLPIVGLGCLIFFIPLEHYLAHKRTYLQAHLIQVLMFIVLAISGVVVLGWDSGMQYVLISSAVTIQFYMTGRKMYKLSVVIILTFLLIALAIYSDYNGPSFLMPSPYLDILRYFNILIVMLIFVEMTNIVDTLQDFEEEAIKSNLENEKLLHNILPKKVAQELRETGRVKPARFEDVSIMFSDFKGFTNIVASIPTKKLIEELNEIFSQFDDIVESEGVEKIQTVGDGYLAACGLPTVKGDHAQRCVRAARKMIEFLNKRNETSAIKWKMRIGIHSGPISAGVIGKKKFAYNIFGDTINTASRIESNGEAGKINVSAYTYDLIKDEFPSEYRGKLNAKGKGELDMYFVK